MTKSAGKLMKKILIIGIIVAAANIFLARTFDNANTIDIKNDTLKVVEPAKYYSTEEQLITTLLSRYHYKKFTLNDSLSGVIFDRYIKTLDYGHMYFLASDIEEFQQYRDELDNDLKAGEVHPAYKIFNVFRDRVEQRVEYINNLLNADKEFDFTKDEKYLVKREDAPWPENEQELNEVWRKRIKNDALNLKLQDKDWKGIVETLKEKIRKF